MPSGTLCSLHIDVDNAINLALYYLLQHLDGPNMYAHVLFVNFTSAFNAIIPDLLLDRLCQLNIDHLSATGSTMSCPTGNSVSGWVTTFLTLSASAGMCALSPALRSLYTNDCHSNSNSVKLIKFADDTTLVSLISNNDVHAPGESNTAGAIVQSNMELNRGDEY